MLLDALREFVTLARVAGKASNPRLKELMVTLRRAGLTSPQIAQLSGGWLSATIVRQYTRGWRGVDKKLGKELDALMGPLRELVLSDRGVGDVVAFNALKKSVELKESSIEAVAELDVHLGNIRLKRGEVGRVVDLSRRLDANDLTVDEVEAQMVLDEELSKAGFKEPRRRQLAEMTRDYGGFEKVLENIGRYTRVVDSEALEKAADIRAAKASARADAGEGMAKFYEDQVTAIATCIGNGWALQALVYAPIVLKWADTAEKRETITDRLREFEWYSIPDGGTRLVKIRKVYHNPALMTETLGELRAVCNESAPFGHNQLVKLTSILLEKLPGLTLDDYAHILLRAPDLTEQERKTAEYLIRIGDAVKEVVDSDDQFMLRAENNMWRLQNAALEEKHRKLRMRYPTPVQQEIFDRVLQLATNTIPPKADLRQYWGVMGFVMNNLAEAASKDEKLTIDEKDVMAGLSKYSGLLDRVNPQRAREEDIRIDAPTGGIKSPPVGDENDTPQSSTRRVDYDLLKRIDRETRDKIIPRILPYSEFTDELIEEISEKLGVERAIVETLINYLMTDPASRNELREMGYSNSQLSGWVVIIPGDKFASSTKSEKDLGARIDNSGRDIYPIFILAFKTLESSFKPPEHSFKCVGLSRIPHSYNNRGKMAVKRLTIRYSLAAVVVALAIIGTSLYVNPIANAQTNFAVMLTDPPVVPDGTTKLEVKYSYVQVHVVASDGTDHWEDSQDGGTVDLLSLVGVSQTIGNLDIKTGSTVDRIKFTITGAKATINGQVYPVTILSEQLIINLTKVKLDGINTGALIDLRPVLHEIKAIDANGDPVSYYVLVPSATAVVKKNVSEEHKKVGAKHDLTDEEEEELEDEYENASKDVSIEDADLVVNGADTVLTLVIKNNGPKNVVIHGITVHGDFTFSSPAQSSHSKENDHPRTIPFEVGSDGKLVPRMSGGDDHHDDGKGLELLPGETKTLSFSGKIQIQPNDHGKGSPITISFIDGYDYTIRVSGEGSQTKTVKANAP